MLVFISRNLYNNTNVNNNFVFKNQTYKITICDNRAILEFMQNSVVSN